MEWVGGWVVEGHECMREGNDGLMRAVVKDGQNSYRWAEQAINAV